MKRVFAATVVAVLAFEAWAAGKPGAPVATPKPESRQLRILQKVMPAYEQLPGADGSCVTVKFLVKHDGFVGDVTVLEARPAAMAEPTVAALKQWWFQSFPPPDVYAVQTLRFPETRLRHPYLIPVNGSDWNSEGCRPAPETRELRVLQRVMPAYEQLPGADGSCVTVKFLVKHDGFVGDVTVLEARPAAMAEPTVAALKQWWFQSFPPPDVYAVQTLRFPETRLRHPYLVPVNGSDWNSGGCGPAPPSKPAAPAPETRELRVLQRVMPTYGARAGVGDGGCVTVRFQIRHDGFVGDITVLEAKPEAMAEPTVAAMKQWVFQSFPAGGPDVYAVQTFQYTPETVRLPDDAIRAPFALLGDGAAVESAGCGKTSVGKPKS